MQSDAITFSEATLDQSMREAFDFRSQSFVSPYLLVFNESNLFSACFDMMIQSSWRCHSHFHFQDASTYLPTKPNFHIPFQTNSGARVSKRMRLERGRHRFHWNSNPKFLLLTSSILKLWLGNSLEIGWLRWRMRMSKTFVLIHESWHGGWAWKDVIHRLSEKGYGAHAPTLAGHGPGVTRK